MPNLRWFHLSATSGPFKSGVRLPLIAIKLDVASACDHLSHSAIAKFLAHCGPCLESHVLLRIMVLSRVLVSITDVSWEQRLLRGIVQGSSYSAEIFARAIDFFLGSLVSLWHENEPTWISPLKKVNLLRRIPRSFDRFWDFLSGCSLCEIIKIPSVRVRSEEDQPACRSCVERSERLAVNAPGSSMCDPQRPMC